MKNKNGFTLVEILIVITIISIIMVLAVPNIMKMSERMKDRGYKGKAELIEKAAVNYVSSNANSIRSKLNNNYIIDTASLDNKGKKYIFGINVRKLIEEDAYKSETDDGECSVPDPRNETKCLDCQTIIIILDDENRTATANLNDSADSSCTDDTNEYIEIDNKETVYKNIRGLS